MNYVRAMLLLLVVSLMLPGCKKRDEKKQVDKLETAVFTYEGVMRWSYFGQVLQMYKSTDDSELLEWPSNMDDIRITGYDIVYPLHIDKDGKKASQTVVLSYVHEDRQIVRELQNTQNWEYDEKVKVWFLRPPLPEFP